MKSLLILLSLVGSGSAMASSGPAVAFERFSYEVAKGNSPEFKFSALASYSEELKRFDSEISARSGCEKSLASGKLDRNFCMPSQFAAFSGGTGGVQ